MTLSPSESLQIRPITSREAYRLNKICAHPECDQPARDGHHLWRRTMTGVPAHWVEVDGHIVGNLVGLCRAHHEDVNGGIGGHLAWITFEDGEFVWSVNLHGEWHKLGPLSWQPPGGKEVQDKHEQLPEGEPCPTCGHRKPRKPREPGKPKTRFTVMYPKDETVVLPELIEQARLAVGRPTDTAPYYVLVEALVFLLQHEHLLEKR